MTINKFRGFLYALARILGDVQAIRHGPKAVLRRIGRRIAGRESGRLLSKMFR